jgi:hypothetical protein
MSVQRRAGRILFVAVLSLPWLTPTAAQGRGTPVPQIRQEGEVGNCGPTAAAMAVAAYLGLHNVRRVKRLRDRMGRWSWREFPLRAWRLPGYGAGMTTPGMLHATLERFGGDLTFHPIVPAQVDHPHIAEATLRRSLAGGRPVVTLVQSGTLWASTGLGLHWVVVVAIEGDTVHYNDPGDGKRIQVPMARFLRAWRLDALFRILPGLRAYAGFAGDRAARPHSPGDRIARHDPSRVNGHQ